MAKKIKAEHIRTGMGVIGRFARLYRKEAIILFIAGILSAIGNGVVPYISGRLFDSIIVYNQSVYLFKFELPLFGVLLAALVIIQLITAWIERITVMTNSRFGFFLRFDYESQAYGRLLDLPLAFHKKKKIGDITSKIGNAGNGLEIISFQLLGRIVPQLLTVLIAIILLFSIHKELSLVAIGVLAIYIILSYALLGDSGKMHEKLMAGWGKAFGDAHDTVNNITTVKQFTTENYERKKLKKSFVQNIFPFWYNLDRIWQTLYLWQRIGIIILQIIVFVWSVGLVQDGNMTIGQLIAFNSYLALLFGPFTSLLDFWRILQNAFINIHGVEKILSQPAEQYHPSNVVPLNDISGNIEFQNVNYSYEKKKPILVDIEFKAGSGQTIALVGESGVGKSTLIDLLSGYHFAQKGKVLIDGVDIRRLNLNFLRSKIGVVPQEVVLFNDTIKKNIAYGNFKATTEEIEAAAAKAHALEFIDKFPKKWKQVVGEQGVKLSVGQKQRVAIARAILRDPSILILDEPTSALDAKSEKIIQESLDELMSGRTTFIVAHRLSTVRKANLILVFEEGKIVERGTHDELMLLENGKYRHLYELQIGLHK